MVRNPIRLAVRMMRQAISPRLAMRTEVNIRRAPALRREDTSAPAAPRIGAPAAPVGAAAAPGPGALALRRGRAPEPKSESAAPPGPAPPSGGPAQDS